MIILSTHVTMTPNRGMKNFYNTKVDGVKVFRYSDETAEAVASGEKLLKESQTVYESFADMMSPDDAAKYLDFLENGSREGLTSAELAGVEKADALLVSRKVEYEDVWDLRNAGDVLESGSKGGLSTQGYSNFADGMLPEDATRCILNNEKAFFNEFSERASAVGLSDTQIAEAFEAMKNGDYANGAEGIATYAHPDGYVGKVWSNIEKQILEENDIIIQEVIIDAK